MIKVIIVPEHTSERFITTRRTVDKSLIIEHSARVAGECYDQVGWEKLAIEPLENTKRREHMTLGVDDGSSYGSEHATPYEHIVIGLEITGPKILMMTLNNERQCSTSEKSARYTVFKPENGISKLEADLYNKWLPIYENLIASFYRSVFDEKKITKLAQENARYLTSVFTTTKMIHTVPWVQLNRIACLMNDFCEKPGKTFFEQKVADEYIMFVAELDRLGILDKRAMSNRKHRRLSLFGDHLVEERYGRDVYSTSYKGSFAQLAQAHRHRTISYNMVMADNFECYVPPILRGFSDIVREWRHDMDLVKNNFPQGQLVHVNECGTVDAFLLKCKERLCSAAQLEIMLQTKETLNQLCSEVEYDETLGACASHSYMGGARCTFPDYDCAQPCGFVDGVNLSRLI